MVPYSVLCWASPVVTWVTKFIRMEIRKEQKELGATEGVQVVEVTEGGSADGFLQKNDVILKLNDKTVKHHGPTSGNIG